MVFAFLGAAGALGVLVATFARRAHRLEAQLQSLAQPLHELRGALTALELGLALAERSPGSRWRLKECVESLRPSLERAALGARDIDALRRGENSAVAAKGDVNFNTLVLRNARAWALLAPSYAATLEVDWRAGPVRVIGHAGRLQQALDNLIANALEHGGGSVLVEGERRGRLVHVLLSDGGPGLPRPLGATVNGNGSHPAASSSKRGHGLAIARAVIQEHGGRLGLGTGRNGPGFLVELPIAEGGDAPLSIARPNGRPPSRSLTSNAA
jgi:two-component system OmpR family sensor kinase